MIDKTKNSPLYKRREEKGLSREQLSKMLNGSPSAETIARIERGERIPRADTLKLLAGALDCSTKYLTGEIPYPDEVTSDIAAELPLTDKSINLLRELNKEPIYEDLSVFEQDSMICRTLVDELIFKVLADHEDDGRNVVLLDLLHRAFDAAKVTAEYEGVKWDDGKMVLKYSPMELRRNPPDRYRMASWERDACETKIADIFREIIHTYISSMAELIELDSKEV